MALENIFLQATELNIGFCCVSQLINLCNEHYIRRVLDKIEIPEDHQVIGCATLGYSNESEEVEINRNQNVIHCNCTMM